MVDIKKVINKWKYSSTNEKLSLYESYFIKSSKFKKCPRCKENSLIVHDINGNYCYDQHHCNICGFSIRLHIKFGDGTYLVNTGVDVRFIDQQKARVLKIKKIQKANEARRNRVKSI